MRRFLFSFLISLPACWSTSGQASMSDDFHVCLPDDDQQEITEPPPYGSNDALEKLMEVSLCCGCFSADLPEILLATEGVAEKIAAYLSACCRRLCCRKAQAPQKSD